MSAGVQCAYKTWWDFVGCSASSACAVHCLLTPFLFLALPAFAEMWAHPVSHVLMAILVIPLALTVVVQGYRKHRERWVLGAAMLGIAFILVGCLLPAFPSSEAAAPIAKESLVAASCCPSVVSDDSGGSRVELPPASIASIAGSLLLIAAHVRNWRGRRGCRVPVVPPPSEPIVSV
jgi:hypothetical protein